MAQLTYMPNADDLDETTVAGVTFKAYEPVEVTGWLLDKLKVNKWFTAGDVDPDRKKQWEMVRHAQAQAKAHRELADKIEKNPSILKIPEATAELMAADIDATPSSLN